MASQTILATSGDPVSDFFEVEDGRLLPIIPPPPERQTVLPNYGTHHFSLADLCTHIDTQPSLQGARIYTVESYKQTVHLVVPHKFLVIELRRTGKKNIWLRLDRGRGDKSPKDRSHFIPGAETVANDTAILYPRQPFRYNAELQNRQAFTSPPSLGDFRRLLGIVCDELKTYQLWPENCWFFCSLIQQHLKGQFVLGRLQDAELGQSIRQKIAERFKRLPTLQLDSPAVHKTPTVLEAGLVTADKNMVTSIPSPLDLKLPKDLVPGLQHVIDELCTLPSTSPAGQDIHANNLAVKRAVVQLHQVLTSYDPRTYSPLLFTSLEDLRSYLKPLDRAFELVAVEKQIATTQRELYAMEPVAHCVSYAASLEAYGSSLRSLKRFSDAYAAEKEAVTLRQQMYLLDPTAHRSSYAVALYRCSSDLRALSRFADACDADETAVALHREMYRLNPEANVKMLVASLNNYNVDLGTAQRFTEACTMGKEAAELGRQLYKLEPKAHRRLLLAALRNLQTSLDGNGQTAEAKIIWNERRQLEATAT